MTKIKERAITLIKNMPEERMVYIVNVLEGMRGSKQGHVKDKEKSMEALQGILSFAGRIPSDFDMKAELESAREERYGSFG